MESNDLSARQRKIARYAAEGLSSKHIAVELGLSESTVSGHVNRVAMKLGLGSRLELVSTPAVLTAMSASHRSDA